MTLDGYGVMRRVSKVVELWKTYVLTSEQSADTIDNIVKDRSRDEDEKIHNS